jgi:ketosteroid isomerase-like protein
MEPPEPGLRELKDELAIRGLAAAYTDAINRCHIDDAIQVYAPDGVFTMMDRPSVTGSDQIADVLRSTVSRYELLMQLAHSGVVQLNGDSARARWQITELQVTFDGKRRFIAGRYEDELARLQQGWRFTRRTFTARYLGDVSLTNDVVPDIPVLFPLWR